MSEARAVARVRLSFRRNQLSTSIGFFVMGIVGLSMAAYGGDGGTRVFGAVLCVFSVVVVLRAVLAYSVSFTETVMTVRTLGRTRRYDLSHVVAVEGRLGVVLLRRRRILEVVSEQGVDRFQDLNEPALGSESGVVTRTINEWRARRSCV